MPDPTSGAKPTPAIIVTDVAKSFAGQRGSPDVPALADVSLQVPEGAFTTILGPSGCGKTTLLRLLDGLIRPDHGRVAVFGKPPRPGLGIGFVFQSFRLLPWRTIRQNVAMPLDLAGVDPAMRDAAVSKYLELVGLARVATAYPAQLSGGMQQRVAIARALVGEPDLLLMDEPFASVDAQTRELMQIELLRLWSRRRCTVAFVTHSIEEAILLGDRVVLMGGRPGRVLETFEVELPRPRDPITVRSSAAFLDLSARLSRRLRHLVISDPDSEFHGRV